MLDHSVQYKKTPLDANEKIYRVSELNHTVQNLIEGAFLPIWVEGEISNFASPSSGHWYFSLKDQQAQVRCVLFMGRQRYKKVCPKEGMQVLLHAKLSLYAARGEFQLVVDSLEPAGEGALRRAFEMLKTRLAAEGLFADARKQRLPKFPKAIGVITSETGAAIQDICTVLKRRFPSIAVIVYPCLVQGKTAAMQISQQIQRANQRRECDVLIIARGGGSLEDLWSFNEESVARAIFSSELPIISGIGHETDFTIADFVADYRAATPSMAAQLASPNREEFLPSLTKTQHSLVRLIQQQLTHLQQKLQQLQKGLRHPRQRLQENSQQLDELAQRLGSAVTRTLQIKQQQLSHLARTLQAVSPLASLARGYALVTHISTKQLVRHLQQVTVGDKITVKLVDGDLICQVQDKLTQGE